MMKRKVNETEASASNPKRLRFDMGAVVSMVKNLMSSANAVPFLRKGRFEECEDKMYLEDVLSRVEDGSHQDIDGVFSDIYKVLKTERDGNEIQLEDKEKQVYDEADALIMAGMMIKTAKSLQKQIEDVLKVDEQDEDEEDTIILENSTTVLSKLKKQFESIPDNALHDEAVKMMFADAEGRKKIMDDLSRMDHVYKPKFDVVKIDEDDAIYKQMSNYFNRTLGSWEKGENCEIENIFKINNNFISDIYNDASNEMERKLGEKPREELLFHGTSDKAIAAILKNNFDPDACPTDQRQKRSHYGKGIYFSSSSSGALLYGNNIMVCKVILGNYEIISFDEASNMTREIPAQYDSRKVTRKDEKEAQICVVKENHHVLPYCVITLKNKELSSEKRKHTLVSSEKKKLATKLGKIREILTSDDETIKKHHLTSVYLDYIKMIEKREETSKDAPTEEVKNNVSKIYKEVTSGGLFSSLTQGIRGMFGSRMSATSSNFDQIWSLQRQRVGQASTSTDTAPSTNAVTIRSFASFNKHCEVLVSCSDK